MTASEAEFARASAPAARRAPWYVEMLLAIGGWVAGLLAAAAIFAFVAVFIPNLRDGDAAAAAGLAIGAAAATAGTLLGRSRRGEFARHFAIAAVAAGLTAAVAGFWYLAWSLGKELYAGEEYRRLRIGVAGLATDAALLGAGFAVARALKDGILSFLVALFWFAILALSVSVLYSENAVPRAIFDLVPALAALLGMNLFRESTGQGRPAGAALMVGPMLYYEALKDGAGWFRIPEAGALIGEVPTAIFAGAILYCLVAMRGRFPALALVGAGALLGAGVWFLPAAGKAAILMLAAGFAAAHRGLAAVGVVAFAWFVSRFYYDLSQTLLTKSLILAGLGAATLFGALILRRVLRGRGLNLAGTRAPRARPGVVAAASFGALLAGALFLIDRQVADLESAFKEAREIYLPLGPVDPRSLLQGDYMALNFRETIYPPPDEAAALPRTGEVFLKLDGNGVASFSRAAGADAQPAADEVRVDYRKTGAGDLRYCPTSFFFQEGEAEAFSAARFAVLAVAADGRARLVALADAERVVIDPRAATSAAPPAAVDR